MSTRDGESASDTIGSATGPDTLANGTCVAELLEAARRSGLAALDAQLLLARATGWSRSVLQAYGERGVEAAARTQFAAECARRLAGEPLAYIEGSKEFWSLPLQVSPAVLVPRPETELLVELCLAALPIQAQQVADLGTGSGAIALALAHERPQWSITAIDVSPAALAVAQANATRLGLGNVTFRQGHWCDALADQRVLDAVLSNPPYVAPRDPALAALAFEPISALVAGDEGYADLLTVARQARRHLRPGGLLLLEHGSTQAPQLAEALANLGYADILCHRDLAGLPRVTQACWPAIAHSDGALACD